MGRLGSVKDAGCLTVFLLSDEAEYITGQEIVMDGAATIVETKEIIKKGEKKI
jgi:NAD(P)-dependent dehydrogenase (short-subunit alcohol dehydrogenase family)